MTSRLKYSNEEKILIVNEYAKSGLSKLEIVKQHTEYKTGTLLKWLSKYFPSTNKDGNRLILLTFLKKIKTASVSLKSLWKRLK